jgi:hypothetical protein
MERTIKKQRNMISKMKQRRLGAITSQGVTVKSLILLSQHWKN